MITQTLHALLVNMVILILLSIGEEASDMEVGSKEVIELDEGEIISSGEDNLNDLDNVKSIKQQQHQNRNDEMDDYEEGEIKEKDDFEEIRIFPASTTETESPTVSNRSFTEGSSSRRRDDRGNNDKGTLKNNLHILILEIEQVSKFHIILPFMNH